MFQEVYTKGATCSEDLLGRWLFVFSVWRVRQIILAPQVGLEPTTLRLTAECSTIELLRSKAGRRFAFNYIKPRRALSNRTCLLNWKSRHGIGKNIRAAALRVPLGAMVGRNRHLPRRCQSPRCAVFSGRSSAQRHRLDAHRAHARTLADRCRHPLAPHVAATTRCSCPVSTTPASPLRCWWSVAWPPRVSAAASSAEKNSCGASGSGKKNSAAASPVR